MTIEERAEVASLQSQLAKEDALAQTIVREEAFTEVVRRDLEIFERERDRRLASD